MWRVVVVFLGGGIGAGLRALALAWLAPWGTTAPVLLVNLLGAFLLGMIFVAADEAGLLGARTRLFLAVGVLGGFTTFSTYGWGVDVLLGQGQPDSAGIYLVAGVAGGIAAVGLGLKVGRIAAPLLKRAGIPPRNHGHAEDAETLMDAIEAEDRTPRH